MEVESCQVDGMAAGKVMAKPVTLGCFIYKLGTMFNLLVRPAKLLHLNLVMQHHFLDFSLANSQGTNHELHNQSNIC